MQYSTPRYSTNLNVKYGKESGFYQISGANDEEVKIENRQLLNGRFISPKDIDEKQNVAVIGRMVQRDLIKNGDPVGKELEINGSVFKVIGVFSDDGGDWDERMISIPISYLWPVSLSIVAPVPPLIVVVLCANTSSVTLSLLLSCFGLRKTGSCL